MDCAKVGRLIYQLRKEKGMTQKQLADQLRLSAKTVSKWECGLGCPDVSLLAALSCVLDADIEKILSGNLSPNETDGGNMKKVRFYVCPTCGNTLTATGDGAVSCCGRKLQALPVQAADPAHTPEITEMEEDLYLTLPHPMTKAHFITFVAYVTCNALMLVKLYPEQNPELRIPNLRGDGTLYLHCNQAGLFRIR